MVNTRDHGGNLSQARAAYGEGDWIDLSTGINRRPYPVPSIEPQAWTALPTSDAYSAVIHAAATAYGTRPGAILPLAGAQAAIQLYPLLRTPGLARVLTPTYNEHAAALKSHGWTVQGVPDLADLAGAKIAVVVNPNNPDGRQYSPQELREISRSVGLLVIDESFADPHPELSCAAFASDQMLVLRSFGKFYGLAGVRLGFALAGVDTLATLREMAGPWSVCGPALSIGATALRDADWAQATTARLAEDCARLDAMALGFGWSLVGGTALFRTYATPDAKKAQHHLATRHIWSRQFPYSKTWLRLGLPDGADWPRVSAAFKRLG
ncbi:threonine-phosphate decarboxylase CobD [Pararhodobacter sp.]|uniref:threonine-phosphate decarboxylase CobD n=1 Tax=Pararhodobacter sp. TaxID=2127056 RepID=UPI002AFEF9AB|nr:threonine-phosphate decarboxylase CobD [Pararhodobacter sp.]